MHTDEWCLTYPRRAKTPKNPKKRHINDPSEPCYTAFIVVFARFSFELETATRSESMGNDFVIVFYWSLFTPWNKNNNFEYLGNNSEL